ncbi:substrate-binding domain-containing protein [Vibrio sp. WXL103]|uniref:substrate-binding domain-containing protein n=1 Tax=Vibrio sp. WXL103 TaxID=3450710 RepID=UPI003EC79641
MKSTLFSLVVTSLVFVTAPSTFADELPRVRLATTTSTYHSGLLDYLIPEFKKETGYHVDVIAAGTGKALKMGENGDVDILMTHAPQAEQAFVEAGYGIEPKALMYNDFVVVGPKTDPAQLQKVEQVTNAFAQIAERNELFVSRGDDSGTHKKELTLWSIAGVTPEFSAYRSVGQGMGPTLNMSSEMQAYTLTDRGTWLAYHNNLDLAIVLEGDKLLFNPYQVILVNPQRYPDLNHTGAKAFSDWLVNDRGQQLINSFQLNGQQLFMANAATTEEK